MHHQRQHDSTRQKCVHAIPQEHSTEFGNGKVRHFGDERVAYSLSECIDNRSRNFRDGKRNSIHAKQAETDKPSKNQPVGLRRKKIESRSQQNPFAEVNQTMYALLLPAEGVTDAGNQPPVKADRKPVRHTDNGSQNQCPY